MFISLFAIGVLIWGVLVLLRVKRGSAFKFSVGRYYLLLSAFLPAIFVHAFLERSADVLVIFVTYAITGMLGETLFSVWWHIFFEKKFWAYRVETLAHAYTSFLNVIPWGLGGLLYIYIAKLFGAEFGEKALPNSSFWAVFLISFLVGLALQFVVWVIFSANNRLDFKFKEVSFGNYIFFLFPFLLALGACSAFFGEIFLAIALTFAVVLCLFEYLFGKVVEYFISQKLWVYNYLSQDGGHFTFLSLVPFAFAGFYFWAISYVLEAVFRVTF